MTGAQYTLAHLLEIYSDVCLFNVLSDNDFDQSLSSHSKALSFFIEALNHPDGKIHVDSPLFSPRMPCLGEVKILGDIFTLVEFLVEFLSFHMPQPPAFALVERK